MKSIFLSLAYPTGGGLVLLRFKAGAPNLTVTDILDPIGSSPNFSIISGLLTRSCPCLWVTATSLDITKNALGEPHHPWTSLSQVSRCHGLHGSPSLSQMRSTHLYAILSMKSLHNTHLIFSLFHLSKDDWQQWLVSHAANSPWKVSLAHQKFISYLHLEPPPPHTSVNQHSRLQCVSLLRCLRVLSGLGEGHSDLKFPLNKCMATGPTPWGPTVISDWQVHC